MILEVFWSLLPFFVTFPLLGEILKGEAYGRSKRKRGSGGTS